MEDQMIRRREFAPSKIDIPLVFQLVILLRNRKEVLYLCTKSSLALRVLYLCEMAIKNEIALNNYSDKVVVSKAADSVIPREFQQAISSVEYDCKNLIQFLNGEKSSALGIKNLRNRVYVEMENKGLVKINKGKIYNKIKLLRHDVWQNIYNKIVHEISNKNLSLQTIAILEALNYIDSLESLLLQCNEVTGKMIVETVNEITKERPNKLNGENKLFYELLSQLRK